MPAGGIPKPFATREEFFTAGSLESAEAPLRRPAAQFVGEIQQEGQVKVTLGFPDFRTRENGEAFAVRVEVENPYKIRL